MFWLQLWTLEKFSEPRVSRNDSAKEVEKCRKLHLFAAMTVTFRLESCAVRNVPCAVTFLMPSQAIF